MEMKLGLTILISLFLPARLAFAGEAVTFENYLKHNSSDPALKKKPVIQHQVFVPTAPYVSPDAAKPAVAPGTNGINAMQGSGGPDSGGPSGLGGGSQQSPGGESVDSNEALKAANQSDEAMSKQTSAEVQAIIKQNATSPQPAATAPAQAPGFTMGSGSSSSSQTAPTTSSSSNHPVLNEQQQAIVNRGTSVLERARERERQRQAEIKRQQEEAARLAAIRAQEEEAARRGGPGFNHSR